MTHSVPRIFSPSSLRITRSTPCVEGCCGPILRTNSVESKNVASGIPCSLAAFDLQVFPHPGLVLLNYRIVLSQRVSLPLFGEEDAPHVGMAGELDAEHVENFALQPVGASVDGDGGFRFVALGDVRFHANALVAREAVEDVDHVEAVGAFGPIDGG